MGKMAKVFTDQDLIGFTMILGFCTVLLMLKASSAFRERFDSSKQNVEASKGGELTTSQLELEGKKDGILDGTVAHPNRNLNIEPHDPSRTVLIVDDDPVTRRQLRTHLEKLHLKVKEVSDGPAAVQLYKEGVRFCMVVMDYEMPDMNGLLATKKIRTYDNDVVIVGSTIHDPATKQDEFLKAGANFVDMKPISAERLGEFVAEYNLAT